MFYYTALKSLEMERNVLVTELLFTSASLHFHAFSQELQSLSPNRVYVSENIYYDFLPVELAESSRGFSALCRYLLPYISDDGTIVISEKHLEMLKVKYRDLGNEVEKRLVKYVICHNCTRKFAVASSRAKDSDLLPQMIAYTKDYFSDGFTQRTAPKLTPALHQLSIREMHYWNESRKETKADQAFAIEKWNFLSHLARSGYFERLTALYTEAIKQVEALTTRGIVSALQYDYTSLSQFKELLPSATSTSIQEYNESQYATNLLLPGPKPKKKKKKKKNIAAESPSKEQVTAKAKGKEREIVKSEERSLPISKKEAPASATSEELTTEALLNARTPLKLHSRVKRWFKVDELNEIRAFDDGSYQNLSKGELQTQLFHHGFTQIIDRIFGNELLKRRYTAPVKRGFAMVAEVKQKNATARRGVISYGLDKRVCFHRMFHPRTNKEFFTKTLAAMSPIAEKTSQSLGEDYLDFEGDTFDVLPETDAIVFIDKKNSAEITIYPLGMDE